MKDKNRQKFNAIDYGVHLTYEFGRHNMIIILKYLLKEKTSFFQYNFKNVSQDITHKHLKFIY